MNKLTFSILSAVLLAVTSCNSYNSLQKSTDNDYKFEAAKQYYAEGYYNRATLLLHDVLAAMKGTNKGEETLFLLAMSRSTRVIPIAFIPKRLGTIAV